MMRNMFNITPIGFAIIGIIFLILFLSYISISFIITKFHIDIIDIYYFIIFFILLFTSLTFYKYWQKEINECNYYYQDYIYYNCGFSYNQNIYNRSIFIPLNISYLKNITIENENAI